MPCPRRSTWAPVARSAGKRSTTVSRFSVPLQQVATTRRIEELRHRILGAAAEPLTVARLAAHAHLNDRRLTRIFKAVLGMTPHARIEPVRVERVRNQLEATDATLERPATTCGLGTVDTLVRAFRR
jgi:transcriptional regulator GlxA family with amidase domain